MNKFTYFIVGAITVAVAFILLFLFAGNVFAKGHHHRHDEPKVEECVEVVSPDPVEFSENVAKYGTVNANYKWFEDPEGTWTLKIDVDPRGGHEDWRSEYPEHWEILFNKPVELPQTIVENHCEPTVTPEPTVAPDTGGPLPTFAGSSTEAPGVCVDDSIGVTANAVALQGTPDDTVTINYALVPNASNVHIVYREEDRGWEHALLNAPNNGNVDIHNLKEGVKYFFSIIGVNGCATGPWSPEFPGQG